MRPRPLLAALTACALISPSVFSQDRDDKEDDGEQSGQFCSATTASVFQSCHLETRDDYARARGICFNLSDGQERRECFDEALADRAEALRLCEQQKDAREDVCELIGEGRYDPPFEPAAFDTDFAHPTHGNPYYPLAVGHRWEYREEGGGNVIDVLGETKLIEGVTCAVVRDRAREDGKVVEDTFDWIAQATNGDVWYCGELSQNFEIFPGDRPQRPELIDIDGSFKTGRDGDKPGILFLGRPTTRSAYRQEFSLGNAEDLAKVLSTTYAYGTDRTLDRFVPRALAQKLCAAGDCIVTRETTALEPEALEHKYYARGIGLFLVVKPKEANGAITTLVNCNFDSRCAMLSSP